MPLLNVRLDAADARKAADLREAGLPVSTLVRDAIRREHARRIGASRGPRKPSDVVRDALVRFPAPARAAARVDPTDRRAVKQHIVDKLSRRA